MPCECHGGVIGSSGYYSFYSCDGTLNEGIGDLGIIICYDVNKPHTNNINDDGPSEFCECYPPVTTTTSSSTSSTTSTTSTSTSTSTSTTTSTSTSTTTTTTTLYPYSYSGIIGKITPECCAVVGSFITAYTTCSPIVLGCVLYDSLSAPIANQKFNSAGYCYETDAAGVVINIINCAATTTTSTTSTSTSTTTSTTTEPLYYYYVAQRCDDILINGTFVSTNNSLVGASFFHEGACWFVSDGNVPGPAITIGTTYETCEDCQIANS
jgi:hypothetical protein